eukprot:TRINITY_DN35486_c0_g1_i1.p1 TRINITY_DN35486_c0_g1~~TRINITY_DN35486_c0_g1_i1.p1  ORF type:complete len:297 (-),score=48.34 TRINITY_DN35486_c0_g1_i1:40-882(-)
MCIRDSLLNYLFSWKLNEIQKETSNFIQAELGKQRNKTYQQENNYICYGCGQIPIKGPRYQCLKCVNFCLCFKCYQAHTHPHQFLRFDQPQRLQELQEIEENFIENQEFQLHLLMEPDSLQIYYVKPYQKFEINYVILNSGIKNFPENLKITCTLGHYNKLEFNNIPKLNAQEQGTITLTLFAPGQEGIEKSSWRLFYSNQDGKKYFIGPELNFKIFVEDQNDQSKKNKNILKQFYKTVNGTLPELNKFVNAHENASLNQLEREYEVKMKKVINCESNFQ